tara:strand:- start:3975 stop:5930 length:1956 start_codon:yes stop_codon:yes gene_type:complete
MAEKTTAFTGPVVVGLNDKKGEIRLTDGKNVNEAKYLSIAAPDNITSDTTLTFPNGAGTAGQILSTDGNGDLSWVNDSAGNPAGTNGQVQTNDGGTFGAISEGTSGQILTSNGAGSAPTFQAAPTGGIAAVVDDTTPELGGTLNLNNQGINGSGTINVSGGSLLLKSNAPTGTNNGPIIGSNTANNVSGFGNMALGTNAGRDFGNCIGNIAVGTGTLLRTTTGGSNVGVGREALRQNITASGNVAVGFQALDNTTSNGNTAIGSSAGANLTSGQNNTLLGASAQPSTATVSNEVTIGNSNVNSLRIPGLQSGASANDVLTFNGTDITLAPAAAADPITSSLNVGPTKTIKLDAVSPDGTRNSFLGENAGANITSGDSNVGIGFGALENNQTGNGNIAIGRAALDQGSTGNNVAIGGNAASTTSGNNNVVIGSGAAANMSGFSGENVIIGRAAGNGSVSGAVRSVIIGDVACLSNAPSDAVAIGANTMASTSGQFNTAVGQSAGSNIGTGTNNSCFGNNADPSSSGVSNEITLGNSSVSTLRCQVTSITALSDARDKKDVEDANIGLDFINDLRPVKFVWDTRDGAKKDIKEVGFIAQELDEVQQKHGVEDHLQLVLKNNPDKLEASPGKLIPILVQAIKDLKKEIDELKKA